MVSNVEIVGGVVGFVILIIIKSLWNGKLNEEINSKVRNDKNANLAHDKINSKLNKLDDIQEDLDDIKKNNNALFEELCVTQRAMVIAHEDDETTDTDAMREVLGLEPMPGDIRKIRKREGGE